MRCFVASKVREMDMKRGEGRKEPQSNWDLTSLFDADEISIDFGRRRKTESKDESIQEIGCRHERLVGQEKGFCKVLICKKTMNGNHVNKTISQNQIDQERKRERKRDLERFRL